MTGVTDFGEESSAQASKISGRNKAVLFARPFEACYQTATAKPSLCSPCKTSLTKRSVCGGSLGLKLFRNKIKVCSISVPS